MQPLDNRTVIEYYFKAVEVVDQFVMQDKPYGKFSPAERNDIDGQKEPVVFYAVSLLTSAFILMKKQRISMIMISFEDLVFSTLVCPLSTFMFATFWNIYLYDRDLLYPKYIDSIIPGWVNHGMHTLIFPLALVEMFVIPHQYPSVGKGLSIVGMTALAYLLIFYFFAKTGKWMYPVFKLLSPLGVLVFARIAIVNLLFYYMLGRFLNRMIWGESSLAKKSSQAPHETFLS
ncbi:Androgen-dependent TPF1-regulating protein, partial [Ophiophagus hannah]